MRIFRCGSCLALMAALVVAACNSNTGDVEDVEEDTLRTQSMTELDAGGNTSQAVDSPAGSESVAEPNPYRVHEAFTVGRDVYVRSMAIDKRRNVVWVGTSAGVLEVDLETRDLKQTYTRDAGLANEYVFAIHVDNTDRIWFGTNGGGISGFNGDDWKTYFPMHGLADYWVYSFGEQSSGDLWIGTWAGVNKFSPTSGVFKTYLKELVNEWVYGIAVGRDDRVWFATEGGISMFDGKAWRAWTHEDGVGAPNSKDLPPSTNTGLGTRARHDLSILREGQETYNPNYVFCITEAQNGEIWAGTWGGGVTRFDGNQWVNLGSSDGLASDIVFSIAQDSQGAFWFGTDKGLSRYDGRQWFSYTQQDGLIDNNVYAVTAAPNGDIWVGTKNGVARLQKIEGHTP